MTRRDNRMKKGMKQLLLAAICSISAAALLAGCGGGSTKTDAGESSTVKSKITITFMNGDTVLGTAEGLAGERLDSASYQKYEEEDGAEFKGWYEAPSFLEPSFKDLSKDTFDESTTLYGNFVLAEAAEDTRKWYIAGTSEKGSLKENNWAGDIDDSLKESFELKATGNAVNEFALTIDLFEGDQFQIIHDWAWTDQKGFGLFTELDETQFESSGSLGGTDNTANVQVLQDGNYTITLTTNPDNPAQDTLTVVRNGDVLQEGAK